MKRRKLWQTWLRLRHTLVGHKCEMLLILMMTAHTGTAKATNTFEQAPILLPPYTVEDDRGKPWKFARVAGIEVLYRSPEDVAAAAVDRYLRLNRMFALLLPARIAGHDRAPHLIIEDKEFEPPVARELSEAITRHIVGLRGKGSVGFMPNFHFWDDDSESLYFVLNTYRQDMSMGELTMAPP